MNIPQGVSLKQILQAMPAEQKTALEKGVTDHLSSLEGSILHQLTISSITAEYTRLGMDMQQTQNQYILRIGLRMILVAVG